mmetsp:Transcript_17352/g.46308  ORF Transcript_17352/g.46308 Transcript_17352/m.46308 type:complete len:366 (-) Transcript_17352:85-1182(-)
MPIATLSTFAALVDHVQETEGLRRLRGAAASLTFSSSRSASDGGSSLTAALAAGGAPATSSPDLRGLVAGDGPPAGTSAARASLLVLPVAAARDVAQDHPRGLRAAAPRDGRPVVLGGNARQAALAADGLAVAPAALVQGGVLLTQRELHGPRAPLGRAAAEAVRVVAPAAREHPSAVAPEAPARAAVPALLAAAAFQGRHGRGSRASSALGVGTPVELRGPAAVLALQLRPLLWRPLPAAWMPILQLGHVFVEPYVLLPLILQPLRQLLQLVAQLLGLVALLLQLLLRALVALLGLALRLLGRLCFFLAGLCPRLQAGGVLLLLFLVLGGEVLQGLLRLLQRAPQCGKTDFDLMCLKPHREWKH